MRVQKNKTMDTMALDYTRKIVEEYNAALQKLHQDNQELRASNKECWVLEWRRSRTNASVCRTYGVYATKKDAINAAAEFFAAGGEPSLSMGKTSFTFANGDEHMEGKLATVGEPIVYKF